MLVVVIIMLALADKVYYLWVGDVVKVPFMLSLVIAAYIIINAWCTIYSVFLNGVGKLKLQLYSGIIGALINIPLAIWLGKTMGVTGVVLASLILAAGNALWSPIQYKKIMNNTATGIWNA
jgi:O-antigen/teichoic acid export membrane protein